MNKQLVALLILAVCVVYSLAQEHIPDHSEDSATGPHPLAKRGVFNYGGFGGYGPYFGGFGHHPYGYPYGYGKGFGFNYGGFGPYAGYHY